MGGTMTEENQYVLNAISGNEDNYFVTTRNGDENWRPADWKQSYINLKYMEMMPYMNTGTLFGDKELDKMKQPCPLLFFPVDHFHVTGEIDYSLARPPWEAFILKTETKALYVVHMDFEKIGYEGFHFIGGDENKPKHSFIVTDLTRLDASDQSLPNMNWSCDGNFRPKGGKEGLSLEIAGVSIGQIMSIFSLMNCKNVEVERTHKADAPMRIVHHRVRPKFDHYYVMINDSLIKSNRELGMGAPGKEGDVRFHMCRGHFKRRQTGTFWWSPHYRGRKECGEITHECEIKT